MQDYISDPEVRALILESVAAGLDVTPVACACGSSEGWEGYTTGSCAKSSERQ